MDKGTPEIQQVIYLQRFAGRPDRGTKRKILSLPEKPKSKERRDEKRAKRVEEKARKIDEQEQYQFKKILKTKADLPVVNREEFIQVQKEQEPISAQDPGSTSNQLTDEEKEKILALVENETEGEAVDSSSVKRMLLSFEKKVTKNQEMRIKFPDHPEKFMDSELELHDEIQKLHVLATAPEFYHIIVKLNAVNSLLGLLNHENTDISIQVIDLLQEMTDVDTLHESEGGASDLIDAMLECQVLAVLVQNLERLDEGQKEDSDGVHNTLAVIENMAEFKPETCAAAGEQGLIAWLLKRLKQKGYDANKLYASEILAIMLQNTEENRQLVGVLNGPDILLQSLNVYKRHDPSNSEELEYMENLFNCLCSTLLHPPNKDLFLKGEGLQLMVLMLREKKLSRCSALKVLDYAMTGPEGGDNCNKFIEILGLRNLFPLFMKPPKRNKKLGTTTEESEEHTCSIIASLFRHLTGSNRTRLVQKFVENDHIKVDRLLELYFKYHSRVQEADIKIEKEKDDLEDQGEIIDDALEDSFYLRRLDAGLFTLQLSVCITLEACSSGVSSIKHRVLTILTQHGGSTKQIKQIMREYAGHVGDSNSNESADLEKRRLLSLVDRF